jgi:hypothetical protein
MKKRILILGHKQHGKDTLAEMLQDIYGFQFTSSSLFYTEKVIFPVLGPRYGYKDLHGCYEDRDAHRAEWYDLISAYNTPEKTRAAREILALNDIYVGMRSGEEFQACKEAGLFDLVVGIFNPRKPLEAASSLSIDVFAASDLVLINNARKVDLYDKVRELESLWDKRLSYSVDLIS